jgi:hypothetical protein
MRKWNKESIDKARRLRLEGITLDLISSIVGIPRSTLWGYIKDVVLPVEITTQKEANQYNRLGLVTRARHEKRRALWNKEMDERGEEVPAAIGTPLFFLGLGLYWGEGNKNERQPITFTNSDPQAIRAYLTFLLETGASMDKLKASLVIYRDTDIEASQKYWAEITGIPIGRIYITIKESSGNPVKQINGTLHIALSDAQFSRKVFGWLRGIKKQFRGPEEVSS